MLYYAYKLVRGTAAIIVFRGFVIIYIIWWITDLLNMNILSSILGGFIGVGVFAVIIVFQQEIRKFLLLLGSSRITNNKSLWKRFNLFFKISKEQTKLNIEEFNCDNLFIPLSAKSITNPVTEKKAVESKMNLRPS